MYHEVSIVRLGTGSYLLRIDPPLRSWHDVAPVLNVVEETKEECIGVALRQLETIRDEMNDVIFALRQADARLR